MTPGLRGPDFRSVLCADDNVPFANNLRDLVRTTGRSAGAVYDGRKAVGRSPTCRSTWSSSTRGRGCSGI